MRFAVVTDIHANLHAWRVVLTDIAAQRADRILCLGDCIGYGPSPSEVLESLYRHVDAFCMGNHDAAVCGKLDLTLFQPTARRLLQWTSRQLSDKAVRFLASQPLLLVGPGFRCVHGDFSEPAAFNYIENAADAACSWSAAPEPLLFTGHTHIPALFVIGASGTTHALPPQDFVLEPGKRYLVNPGSVGNPRSGDALASYCLYDDIAGSVVWRTVPFDLDACRASLTAAGFSEEDTPFLSRDPRQRLAAVREAVSFAPARTPAEHARDVVAVSELTRLSHTARRWKRIALVVALAGALIAAAGLGVALVRPAPLAIGALVTPAADLAPIAPDSSANILPPFPASTDGAALAGWRVRLDRPQTTLLRPDLHGIAVTVDGPPARFRIESPPIRVDHAVMRQVSLTVTWQRQENFSGTLLFAIEQLGVLQENGYPVVRRETRSPPDTQTTLKKTTDSRGLHSQTHFVRVAIEGEYSGTAVFAAPVLRPVLWQAGDR